MYLHFVLVGLGGVISIVLMRLATALLRASNWFIMHDFWPLSVVWPKYSTWYDCLLILAAFLIAWQTVKSYSTWTWAKVFFMCALLQLITTLFQGLSVGFLFPITGHGALDQTYWQDSRLVHEPLTYLEEFSVLMPQLGYHTRVHPPGAVLLFALVRHFTASPLMMGLFLWMVTVSSMWFMYAAAKKEVTEKNARYISILFSFLPAIHIYGYSSLDGLIMSVFFILILWWRKANVNEWLFGIAIGCASLLTYAVLWLIGLFLIWNPARHSSMKVILSFIAFWYVLEWLTGYSYLNSLRLAQHFEGFRDSISLFTLPLNYVITRIQGVVEPMVFLGPWVVWHIYDSWHRYPHHSLVVLGKRALFMFFLFLLAGAYYTGETARAALYLIPPVIISTLPLLSRTNERQKTLLLGVIFFQTVLMQCVGFYSW